MSTAGAILAAVALADARVCAALDVLPLFLSLAAVIALRAAAGRMVRRE